MDWTGIRNKRGERVERSKEWWSRWELKTRGGRGTGKTWKRWIGRKGESETDERRYEEGVYEGEKKEKETKWNRKGHGLKEGEKEKRR
jgi:hypothetical protein